MMGALLVGIVCYSALWTRLNWLYNGGGVHWQPAFAFTRLSQLRSLLPPHFSVMATSVILGRAGCEHPGVGGSIGKDLRQETRAHVSEERA